MSRIISRFTRFAPVLLATAGALFAQTTGTIRGQISDPSAALVPGATVQAVGAGISRSAKSDAQGHYTLNLPAGKYAIRADAKGFVTFVQQEVNVGAGQATALDIALQIAAEAQEVQVNDQAAGAVNTDPSANVGALVLKNDDLEALPDDPDDLQSDLQALAGPAAGPNGAQFFVDGFSGGQLPPKSSIREIRINSNPFSSEFDRPGFGRIEILTKPGTDTWHGGGFFNFGDKIFDSRNPFLTTEPPAYNSKFFAANIGGPLSKKSSFFLDFNDRDVLEEALINATNLDANFNRYSDINAFVTPQKFWTIGPRVDYQLNATNTLVARYNHMESSGISGVGGYALEQLSQNTANHGDVVQITETAILGSKAVDETRFQFRSNRSGSDGSGAAGPTINVSSALTTGGAQVLSNFTNTRGYEFQNNVTLVQGTHSIKIGGRLRQTTLESQSTSNFNGTYTFSTPVNTNVPCLSGISNPDALTVYGQTLSLLKQGVPISTIISNGCGPTQFTLSSGTPYQSIGQFDLGVFAQDDWRIRPNLTVSGGLRLESQNNISDHFDWAPRLSVAWAPGSKGGKPGKTVIRVGAGMFYDRFDESSTLQTLRYNGVSQLNYNINLTQNPATAALALAAFPAIPSTSLLTLQNQAIYKVDSNFQAPYMIQFAAGFDRSLPGRTTLSFNFVDSHGVHDQRLRNINAYLPGTYSTVTRTGTRPFTGQGDIYLYESTGVYNQTQLITNVSNRLNSHLTLQGYYVYGHAKSNVNGFPSNQYDTSVDYGRSSYDIRHRAFIGGTVGLPFRVSAAPFITFSSAPPFNIITGNDVNGDGILNDRPSFATSASNPANVRVTQWGTFNLVPVAGETIIPVNYGTGFNQFSVNMRVSRTWGWGERASANPNAGGFPGGGGPGGGGPGGGGPGGGGGGRGGPGGGGGFGGGPGGMMGFGGGSTGKKYNLTFTVSARNALNHVNYSAPVGTLNSPFFGTSTSTASGGPGGGGPGGPGGGFGGGAAGNRKIELQLRFQF